MITDISSNRLVVISDMHLGNPFSKAKNPIVEFLRWAAQEKYDLCINGDGFEIAQVSFTKIAMETPEVFRALKSFTSSGRNVYYVIGNHDIVLENLLHDWGAFKLAPFLNVTSGSSRIRIEHGHLYDPFFVRNPALYEFLTWFAGIPLKLSPNLYYAWIQFEKIKARFFKPLPIVGGNGIIGEHPNFYTAAKELTERGFDFVVFGHTHHAGQVDLGDGKHYFNTGSWLMGTPFLSITDGAVTLRTWSSAARTRTKISA